MAEGLTCDCSNTDHTGPRCQSPALTALFDGTTSYNLRFRPQQRFHVDDISMRFQPLTCDGLIFQTKARGSANSIKAELKDCQLEVTCTFGGTTTRKTLPPSLVNHGYHSFHLRRRAGHVELSLDDQLLEEFVLPGQDFYHLVDEMVIGSISAQPGIAAPAVKPFIGYMRNFMLGEFNVITELDGDFFTEPSVPQLVFHAATVPTYGQHTTLPALATLAPGSLSMLFKTNDESGVILFATSSSFNRRRAGVGAVGGAASFGPQGPMLLVELFQGKLFVKLMSDPRRPLLDVRTDRQYNDGNWHNLTLTFSDDQLIVQLDRLSSAHGYAEMSNIMLDGPLYIGGMPADLFSTVTIRKLAAARHGFRGCLASLNAGKGGVDLPSLGKQDGLQPGCQEIRSACTPSSCLNGGVCYDHLHNASTWCDCRMTAFAGAACADEPLGYYFRNQGNPDLFGVMKVDVPQAVCNTSAEDNIVFGIMTDQQSGVVARFQSSILDDYVQFSLLKGFLVVEYNTNAGGAATTITNTNRRVADGLYHVVRFTRRADRGVLSVDGRNQTNTHLNSHDVFNSPCLVYLGGTLDAKGGIVNATAFRGILAGVYFNNNLLLGWPARGQNSQLVGDVVQAPSPFQLTPLKLRSTVAPSVWQTDKPDLPDVSGDGNNKVGTNPGISTGGGDGDGDKGDSAGPSWRVTAMAPIALGEGDGGGGVLMFPNGGGAAVYPGLSGMTVIEPKAAAAPTAGEAVAGASVGTGLATLFPASGPRAGGFIGAILATFLFCTACMWAFYLCKPGCCGSGSAPLSITAPDTVPLTFSSKTGVAAPDPEPQAETPLVVGGGDSVDAVGWGGTLSSGQVSQVNVHNINNVNERNIYNEHTINRVNHHTVTNQQETLQQLQASMLQNGVSSSAISGGGGTVQRHASSSSAYSAGNAHYGVRNQRLLSATSAYTADKRSLASNDLDGGSATADYDIAIGVHQPGTYQSSTLPAGGLAAGYSTASLISNNHLNYSLTIKSSKSLSAHNTGTLSHGASVTPGPMGEMVRVDCCLVTRDGSSIVTAGSLGPPQVWNTADGELVRVMGGIASGSTKLHLALNDTVLVGCVAADLPHNNYSLPKGVSHYVLQIWNFASGEPMLTADPEICSALCLMGNEPDCHRVVFVRTDQLGGGTNVVVWDLVSNSALKEMRYDAPVGNNDYANHLAVSQSGRYVVAGFTNSFDNWAEFVVFDTSVSTFTVNEPFILRLDAAPEVTAMLPGDEAVTGLRNGDLIIWNLKGAATHRGLMAPSGTAHGAEVTCVAASENGHYLVTGGADGAARLWDMHKERLLADLSGHQDQVWCVAVSADNEVVATGGRDGALRLWRLRTAQEICCFTAGVDVFHVGLSRDRSTVVALGDRHGARKLIMLQVVRSTVKRTVIS